MLYSNDDFIAVGSKIWIIKQEVKRRETIVSKRWNEGEEKKSRRYVGRKT